MHSRRYGGSPTDLAHGQRCWGRGTHRAGAAWGGGLGIYPASPAQILSQRCSQRCPRTAPSLPPWVSHGVQGQKERGCPAGMVKGGWEKASLQGPGPGCSPHTPHGPSTAGTRGWGASGDQLWVRSRGKGHLPADVPPGRTHTHLSDQTLPASPTLGCNRSPRTRPRGRAPELSWSLGTEAGLAQGQAEVRWDPTVLPQTSALGQPSTAPTAQPRCTVQAWLPHPR